MNQLFIDKLHESMTESNKALIESVELLYRTCEKKAQLEGLGKTLAAGAIGAAIGGAGVLGATNADKIKGVYDDVKNEYHQSIKDDMTISTVANRSFEGKELLEPLGYKFVDAKDKPGLYRTDAFKGINLNDLDNNDYVQVGWWVSPDESKYYSTVTGEVYKMPEGQTFDNASASNPGTKIGDTPAGTGDVSPDAVRECSLTYKATGMNYDGDGCGKYGYRLLDPSGLKALGATK